MFKWRVVRESEAGSGALAATTEDPLATVAAYYDSKYQDNFQTTRLDNFINVDTICRCINCCTLTNVTCYLTYNSYAFRVTMVYNKLYSR